MEKAWGCHRLQIGNIEDLLNKKTEMLSVLDENASFFTNSNEFKTAKEYILSFYEVLVNNAKFKSEIVDQARTN